MRRATTPEEVSALSPDAAAKRARKLAYMKEWRARNAEYVLQVDRARHKTEKHKLRCKEYNDKHKERLRQIAAQRRLVEAEAISLMRRSCYQKRKETILDRNRLWAKKNPDKVLAIRATRRAAKTASSVCNDAELMQLCMREAVSVRLMRERATGIKWHIDHIIPLKNKLVCGLHVPANIRVIPQAVNLWKKNKLLPELANTDPVGAPV